MNYKLFFFLIAIIMSSCKDDIRDLMPSATGKLGEVVIVINKNYWESELGAVVKTTFASNMAMLTRDEPELDLIQTIPSSFAGSYATNRNVVDVGISKKYKTFKIDIFKDAKAIGQTYINIKSPNSKLVIEYLLKNGDKLKNEFINDEKQRIIARYRTREDAKIDKILKKINISMVFPNEFNCDKETEDFYWFAKETRYTSQAIFVYTYDLPDTNIFELNFLLNKRDSILKYNVPGPSEGSFMKTEKKYVTPIYKDVDIRNKKFAYIKGLWKLEGDFMGGPFISYTTIDEKRKKVITVEGYTYSQKFRERNYVYQLEAIISTIKLF